ncbi:hypothetical protein Sa4125_43120 [Aureimonas sp. SA4125]|uniref:hypothetical protein n=1 Tax=Aureimonas sp. SA4125 TaxID=2826993 RepID=UPI001CC711AA|nr:hypothetical protein [Aureimonas sp. SA4125]BDA86770.1 hypothetical protein Sa4125_43120 [Aureimonas sp. SA4125]
MAKHLTARNIAAEFGESSRHWTKLAATGVVPGAFQPKGTATWLFDLDLFRAWHTAGQMPAPRAPVPSPVSKRPKPVVSPRQQRKKEEFSSEIDRLVRSAMPPK